MAEENDVTANKLAEENQVTKKEPQRVVTRVVIKNPKKVEHGKRLAVHNRKKREEQRKEPAKLGKTASGSKPILRNWGCYSSESDRWSWLLHLSNKERTRRRSQGFFNNA